MRLAAPVIWLRDNCPCPQCRHPGRGQRLVSIGGLPADLRRSARHLQGCYADIDGLASTLAVPRRRTG
ncbi:MAG: gamma-butyrobetaine hydroxylase-like domain-containing protein [Streptosporangiaceae bacterium]|jgi:hypothetical protein